MKYKEHYDPQTLVTTYIGKGPGGAAVLQVNATFPIIGVQLMRIESISPLMLKNKEYMERLRAEAIRKLGEDAAKRFSEYL